MCAQHAFSCFIADVKRLVGVPKSVEKQDARKCVLPSERLNVPKFVCRLRPQPKPSRNLSEPQTWVNKPTIAALERRLLAAAEASALGNAAFLRPHLVVSLALRARALFACFALLPPLSPPLPPRGSAIFDSLASCARAHAHERESAPAGRLVASVEWQRVAAAADRPNERRSARPTRRVHCHLRVARVAAFFGCFLRITFCFSSKV